MHPAPPPPPPPPPGLTSSSSSAAKGMSKDLMTDIHKGMRLKKVQTNDRSSPLVDGTNSAQGNVSEKNSATASLSNASSSLTPMRPNGAGGLFANGLPSKPSENKKKQIGLMASRVEDTPPPPPATALTAVRPAASFSNGPKPSVGSTKPSPAPLPPAAYNKPAVSTAFTPTNRANFQTMRPPRSDSVSSHPERINMNRRSSMEDISTIQPPSSVLKPTGRPSVPPPGRPLAPPPPPPSSLQQREDRVAPPPPPPPVLIGSSSRIDRFENSRADAPPPPPPRITSKVPQSVGPPSSSLPFGSSRNNGNMGLANPMDRFKFFPIASLPHPPQPRSRIY